MSNESGAKSANLDNLLTVGTWVLIPYGSGLKDFCVLDRAGDKVLMCRSSWLVSGAIWFTLKELEGLDGVILGHGILRWWRPLLPIINDIIFPFSSYR